MRFIPSIKDRYPERKSRDDRCRNYESNRKLAIGIRKSIFGPCGYSSPESRTHRVASCSKSYSNSVTASRFLMTSTIFMIRKSSTQPRSVKNHVPVFQIDLRNNDAVRDLLHREKFDAIVHLAARAGVRPSIAQPQLYEHPSSPAPCICSTRPGPPGSSASFSVEFVRLRNLQNGPVFRRFSSYSNHQSLCRDQNRGQVLCSTFSHLYQMHIIALRFFTVYRARQRPDLAGSINSPAKFWQTTDRPVRRWHDATRLHPYRRHYSGRGGSIKIRRRDVGHF